MATIEELVNSGTALLTEFQESKDLLQEGLDTINNAGINPNVPVQIPALTTAERDATASPANGMQIYNTDKDVMEDYKYGGLAPAGWSQAGPFLPPDKMHVPEYNLLEVVNVVGTFNSTALSMARSRYSADFHGSLLTAGATYMEITVFGFSTSQNGDGSPQGYAVCLVDMSTGAVVRLDIGTSYGWSQFLAIDALTILNNNTCSVDISNNNTSNDSGKFGINGVTFRKITFTS